MVTFQKALDAGAPLPVEYSSEELTSRPVSSSSMGLREFEPHPLTLAARAGHEAIVRFIIEKGASPDMIDPERLTLLSVAAIYGHVSLTRTLLALGARQDINLLPSRPPLSLASCWGHEEVAATLLSDLENHFDNEALDSQVNGALFETIKKHHKEIVQLLICHVADLNFFSYGNGQPLNAAAKNGDTDILLLMVVASLLTMLWRLRDLSRGAEGKRGTKMTESMKKRVVSLRGLLGRKV